METKVPTYSGEAHYRRLRRRWGLPNAAPAAGETPWGCSRVLFVDDDNEGAPVAYWVPKKEGSMLNRPTRDEVEVTIECLAEDLPIEGNVLCSGDPEEDARAEQRISQELEYNPWAWCLLRVTGKFMGLTAEDYLGGCSYQGEDDFKRDGYYKEMVDTVVAEIQEQVEKIVRWYAGQVVRVLLVAGGGEPAGEAVDHGKIRRDLALLDQAFPSRPIPPADRVHWDPPKDG